jgi:L-lactate dehydrogenase complex protein LldG
VRSGAASCKRKPARRAEARLRNHAPNLIPARSRLPHAEQVALFVHMAEAVKTTVTRVAKDSDVPTALVDYLKGQNLPADRRCARSGSDRYDWSSQPMLMIRRGKRAGCRPSA